MAFLPDSAFMHIPATWTCVDCQREFPNRPDREHAEGFRTAERKLSNGDVQRYIVGHLCKRCMPKPAGVTIQVDSVRLKL